MNDQLSRNPVLIAMSVLAGMQALTVSAGFTDAVPPNVALWVVLGIAALQGAVQFYVRGEVTPVSDPRTDEGERLVPASEAVIYDGEGYYEGRHRPGADIPTVLGQPTDDQE